MNQAELHYAIADLHLGHAKVLEYDGRPYADINQHDADITARCAAVGGPGRTLWLLGDVAYNREILLEFLRVVRPRWRAVHLIRGNHDDRVAWVLRDEFDAAHEARYVRLAPDRRFYLSHYAHRVWRNSNHGSFHLHGHSHGALSRFGRSMDVGANCIGYTPISFEECALQLCENPTINHHGILVDPERIQ